MTTKGNRFLKVPTTSEAADSPVSKDRAGDSCTEARRSSTRLRKTVLPVQRCPSTSSVASTVDMSGRGSDTDTSAGSWYYGGGGSGRNDKKKKRRKASPTAEECVGLASAKKRQTEDPRVAEVRTGEKEEEEEELDGVQPPLRKKDTLPSEEEIAREVRYKPTADIGGKILDSVEAIEKVASVSRNLKGGFIRELRLAARTTRVAVAEMAKRTTATGDAQELEEANLRLRAEVHGLREEVSALRAEIECLRRRSGHTQLQGSGKSFPPPQSAVAAVASLPPTEITPSDRLRVVATMATGVEKEGSRSVDREKGGSSSSDGDTLMGRIGALIERKLGEFREELFPERSIRAPQGLRPERPAGEEEKGKEKDSKEKRRGEEYKREKGKMIGGAGKGKERKDEEERGNPTPSNSRELWSEVVGRKAKKKAKVVAINKNTGGGNEIPSRPPPPPLPTKSVAKTQKGEGKKKKEEGNKKVIPGRPPKTAAVTLTIAVGSRMTYAEAMLRAQERIKLPDLGIAEVRPKRAITGGLILEIPGEESVAKADALATKMEEVFEGTEARVARPLKKTELRVSGIMDSVTSKEIAAAIATKGGCREGDINAGEIRMSPSGLGTLWMRCPTAAARKIVESGSLMVGWAKVKVEALAARPLQCYRCLEKGHVRQRCTAGVDRSRRCYTCGTEGHKASACTASAPRCPLCADLGRPANHRLGGPACSPPSSKRRGSKKMAPQVEKETHSARLERIKKAQIEAEGEMMEVVASPRTEAAQTLATTEKREMAEKVVEERMEVEGEPAQEKKGLEGVNDTNT